MVAPENCQITSCVLSSAPPFVALVTVAPFTVMPIHDLMKQHAFAPDEIKLLVTAFEEALRSFTL
jgi:hypothetical protein